ncbi:predicted protein [Postia placenta Mad-698-R]|uniref:DUF6534 domain-containing protein n=1 Tax=Postia placenta MAD-698-R-SB12 TaxID=670580 RepID=A0A1X6MWG8_9APHY|nr:hypothetical protein POSPLADRAFT_1047992 [Postia placenta MAD-698-R-SB12]EED77902.1 predicted protein [Postia placenta Mad-698-R]OSX60582.1 hypothetical protein POSPLADRAFT_1047992 [Postia placenta MAD-698-R-SB12]
MVLNDVLWSLIVQVALVLLYTTNLELLYWFWENLVRLWASTLFDLYTLLRLRTFDELNALKVGDVVLSLLNMEFYGLAFAGALDVSGDLLIAITLSVLLHGSRTGYRRSDGLINKLIAVLPTAFIYVAFFFLMGRLHTNSLLATLNARKILRVRTVGDDVLSLSLQDLQGSDTLPSGRRNRIPERSPLDIDDTKSQSQERLVSQVRPVPRLGTLGSALAPSRSMMGP